MSEYICRTCHRVVDADLEPSPGEPTTCADCQHRADTEFAAWLAQGWSS